MENQTTLSVTRAVSYVTKNQEQYYPFDDMKVRIIFFVAYTIVFCCCFFGNLIVILVSALNWRRRNMTNFCLANLAFADLCVGIFCIYQNIVTYLMESWIFGDFMCKMYYFINNLSTTASVLILIVICIERYLAIVYPLASKQIMTSTRLRITIASVWVLSAAISSPRFYYFRTISMPLPNNRLETVCLPDRTKYNSKLMDMSNMTILFLLPLAILTILYTKIGTVLWNSGIIRMHNGTSTKFLEAIARKYNHRNTKTNSGESVCITLPPAATLKYSGCSKKSENLHSSLPHSELPSNLAAISKIRSETKQNLNQNLNLHQTVQTAQRLSPESNIYEHSTGSGQTSLGNCRPYTKCLPFQPTVAGKSYEVTSFIRENSIENIIVGKKADSIKTRYNECIKSNTEDGFSRIEPLPTCSRVCTGFQVLSKAPLIPAKVEKQPEANIDAGNKRRTNSVDSKCSYVTPLSEGSNHGGCYTKNLKNTEKPLGLLLGASRRQTTNAHGLNNEHYGEALNEIRLSEFSSKGPVYRMHKDKTNILLKNQGKLADDSLNSTPEWHPNTHYCNSMDLRDGTCSDGYNDAGSSNTQCHELADYSQQFPPGNNTHALENTNVTVVTRVRPNDIENHNTPLGARRKIIRMLIVVVLTFAICHLPFHARKVWQYWSPNWAKYEAGSQFSTFFTPITFLIMYANSAINPIVYAFMSKNFRTNFKELIYCKIRLFRQEH